MTDVMFVILSDVWLDQPRVNNISLWRNSLQAMLSVILSAKVVMKLRELFEGFSTASTVRPLAFIFIGNFVSNPYIFDGGSPAMYRGMANVTTRPKEKK